MRTGKGGRRVREGRSTARRAGSLSPFTTEGEQDDCQDNSAEPTLRAEKQKENKQYRNEATSHILLGSIKTAIPYSPAHREHAAARSVAGCHAATIKRRIRRGGLSPLGRAAAGSVASCRTAARKRRIRRGGVLPRGRAVAGVGRGPPFRSKKAAHPARGRFAARAGSGGGCRGPPCRSNKATHSARGRFAARAGGGGARGFVGRGRRPTTGRLVRIRVRAIVSVGKVSYFQ